LLSYSGAEESILPIAIGPDYTGIDIGPGLIRRTGPPITFELLTDGAAALKLLSPLPDVAIREAESDVEGDPAWARRLQGGAFTLFAVGIFGWFLAADGQGGQGVPFYFVLAVMLFGVLGFFLWITRAIVARWRRAGRPTSADKTG
jgi:hypothetical protein